MTNTDAKIMREAWKPIASAASHRNVLVCNGRHGRPYTVAKAFKVDAGWFYENTNEPLDFTPGFWVEKTVQWDPFHLPLPGATS